MLLLQRPILQPHDGHFSESEFLQQLQLQLPEPLDSGCGDDGSLSGDIDNGRQAAHITSR